MRPPEGGWIVHVHMASLGYGFGKFGVVITFVSSLYVPLQVPVISIFPAVNINYGES